MHNACHFVGWMYFKHNNFTVWQCYLSIDIVFASIGQELRKLHFLVLRNDMIRYKIVRWSVSRDTFGGKHPESRLVEHVHHTL